MSFNSWLQSPSAVILEPKKVKSATVPTVSQLPIYLAAVWASLQDCLCWSFGEICAQRNLKRNTEKTNQTVWWGNRPWMMLNSDVQCSGKLLLGKTILVFQGLHLRPTGALLCLFCFSIAPSHLSPHFSVLTHGHFCAMKDHTPPLPSGLFLFCPSMFFISFPYSRQFFFLGFSCPDSLPALHNSHHSESSRMLVP